MPTLDHAQMMLATLGIAVPASLIAGGWIAFIRIVVEHHGNKLGGG